MPTTTNFKDYYDLLGVSKTATADDIERAYRKLARKHNPDVNPGNSEAEDKFKDINEANEVLSNLETCKKYDQFGQHWKQSAAVGTPPRETDANTAGFNQSSNFDQYSDFDSFINDLLDGLSSRTRAGQPRSRTSAQRPGNFVEFRSQSLAPDTEAAIALSFSEAFQGVQKRLQLDSDTVNIRISAGAKPGS